MAITLTELSWLALDPRAQALFWAEVLGVQATGERVDVPGFSLCFVATEQPKTVQGRIHLDLTSTSTDDQRARVGSVLRLGGRHVDIGQDPADDHVVLADPEGNELCIVGPDNRFLAGTGVLGAVNCDGTRALGLFWGRVLEWPLVWDVGDETAIQSPLGGAKFTWSGPPLMTREDPARVTFHLKAETDHDLARLVELGATSLDDGRFLDPDANEFVVSRG